METTELDKVIQEGLDMESLLKDDKFKKFYSGFTDKLATNLVKNYSGRDEPTRQRIQEQMIMISGLINFVDGTVQAGQMAQAQLDQYNEENKDG